MINVWQTLELIAGSDYKRKAEGYNGINNILKTISKRDSFRNETRITEKQRSTDENAVFPCEKGFNSEKRSGSITKSQPTIRRRIKNKYFRYGKKKMRVKENENNVQEDFDAVIECSFNLPRISARLEKLMGTNVVRLTDRKYMRELRQRLLDDYLVALNKRISAREGKEQERERNLILEGKTDIIPEDLAKHPIFLANKKICKIMAKRRAKIKTARKKNIEKLLRQGAKWEKERLMYEEIDKQKQDEIKEINWTQKLLEEKYTVENAERGLQLLRIENDDFAENELDLKSFLEKEKRQIKVRSRIRPKQYTSDPKDIRNIVEKRRKFRETERRIKKQLDAQSKDASKIISGKETPAKKVLPRVVENEIESKSDVASSEYVHKGEIDSDNSLNEIQLGPHPIIQTEIDNLEKIKAEIEDDVQNQFVAIKAKFEELHFHDPRVVRLKLADNIRELYMLAEEIITEEPMWNWENEEQNEVESEGDFQN